MNDPMIDARWCRRYGAWYGDRRLARLFDRPMTLLEVLTRRDGPWRRVPAVDRLWPFFLAAPVAAKAVVANRAADRQVRAYCLHSGVDAVERWAARWLSDEDRSAAAVWRATGTMQEARTREPGPARGSLWSAAFAATWAPWWAAATASRAPWWTGARVAARAAGYAAAVALKESKKARRAEHLAQLADAIEVLAGEAAKEQP